MREPQEDATDLFGAASGARTRLVDYTHRALRLRDSPKDAKALFEAIPASCCCSCCSRCPCVSDLKCSGGAQCPLEASVASVAGKLRRWRQRLSAATPR